MDFHSIPRRDLQSLCKKNKIPANMTNVAMADALKALETVEGLEEFLNQTESTAPPSPTSLVKEMPTTARTATRTTRRTTTKDMSQTSQSMSRSCRVTRKSLAGEMDQENRNMNVPQSPAVPASRRRAATSVAQNSETNDGETENDVKLEANMPKTPAARSTRRKAPLPASSRSKAPDTKKDESVQQVYSTRRSVRLLEKCMADLSLKPKENLDEPIEDNDTEKETAAQEKDPAGSELQGTSDENSERSEQTEVTPGRDLSATLEKEWMRDGSLEHENCSTDPDPEIAESETQVDLGYISVSSAKSETCKEKMNELEVCQGCDSEENEEPEAIQAFDSSLQVEDKESSEVKALSPSQKMIQDDDSEVSGHAVSATSAVACKEIPDSEFERGPVDHEKIIGKDMTRGGNEDDMMLDQKVDEALKEDAPMSEDAPMNVNTQKDSALRALHENTDSESGQCNSDSDYSESESDGGSEASESEQTEGDSDIEEDPEEEITGVDPNQEVFESDAVVDEADCEGGSVPKSLTVDKLEELEADSESSESDESETESDSEEDDPEEDSISDADSNTAVFGSDVAVRDAGEELESSESEEYETLNVKKAEESDVTVSDKKTPTSPLLMSASKGTTPMSPIAAESISGQFPRPTLSTTPAKSSSKKKQASAQKLTILADDDNKMKENRESYSGRKAEMTEKKKKKNDAFDEESLKGKSMRELTKMLKNLTVKSNRTALQTLPDNQIAEQN